jgi:hypothetical protein
VGCQRSPSLQIYRNQFSGSKLSITQEHLQSIVSGNLLQLQAPYSRLSMPIGKTSYQAGKNPLDAPSPQGTPFMAPISIALFSCKLWLTRTRHQAAQFFNRHELSSGSQLPSLHL